MKKFVSIFEVIAKREDVNDHRLIHCKVKDISKNKITKNFKWRDEFYLNAFTNESLREYLVQLCCDLEQNFNVANFNIAIQDLNWDGANTITKADVIIQYDLVS